MVHWHVSVSWKLPQSTQLFTGSKSQDYVLFPQPRLQIQISDSTLESLKAI